MNVLQTLKDMQLQQDFRELSDRLEAIENKINKTTKKEYTTRGQQILLLHHLGLLDKLNELNLNTSQKAKLLSVLLNVSYDNIRKDLTDVYKPESGLNHEANYNFLVDIFGELNLGELQSKSQKMLKIIQDNKEKVKS